jgi:hypothetical protein
MREFSGQCGGQGRQCSLGALEWYATAQNFLHVVYELRLHQSISLPLPTTLGSPVVQPQSPVGAVLFFTKTEGADDQAHLREGRASKTGRGVESLIASWAQVTQDGCYGLCPLQRVLRRCLP